MASECLSISFILIYVGMMNILPSVELVDIYYTSYSQPAIWDTGVCAGVLTLTNNGVTISYMSANNG